MADNIEHQDKGELVANCDRFYSHRLKASCATNGYLLDFYWKLGRDIEAKQYTNPERLQIIYADYRGIGKGVER